MLKLIITDVLYIPFIIRSWAVLTRAVQIALSRKLDFLIECYSNILTTNAVMNFSKENNHFHKFMDLSKRTVE